LPVPAGLGSVRIDNDPKALVRECRKAGRGAPVAIEATYGWYWAVDALQAARFEVHLAHRGQAGRPRRLDRGTSTAPQSAIMVIALVALLLVGAVVLATISDA
jgi:hypothetical protein